MRQQLPIVALLLAIALAPLSAQSDVRTVEWAEIQPGARVRVQSPGIVAGKRVATVLARTSDTLTIGGPSSVPIAIPVARITSLEISRGKSRASGALRGIQWGAPLGLGLGVLMMPMIVTCDGCNDIAYVRGALVAEGALSGVLYGSVIGAIVGRERWDSYTVTQHASIGFSPGGVSLATRFTF